jgi:hypothetical protein
VAALREILVAFGVTFDTKPIEDGEKKIGGLLDSVKGLGAALAGAFAVDKIKDFVLGAVEAGDALGDQAQRLNISSKALEEWTYAAKFADLQGGELDGIFNKLARSAVEAGDASSDQGKVLKKLGVDVKDGNKHFKDSGQLFEEVGLALAGMKDETERTALSFQFFGKTAGPKVLQIFKDGPEGIAKMRAEFEELGGGMGDFVAEAGAVDDNMHRLNLAWVSAKVKVAAFFLPALNIAIAGLTKLSMFLTYLTKNTEVVQAALAVFAALAAGKAAVLIAAWLPALLPFLKFAAIIGVVILLVEDLIVAWQGGDSLIGRILDRLWGPGSTRKVVAWCRETIDAFSTFFSDLKDKPAEFEDNWRRTTASIKNDIVNVLGPTFGGMVNAWLDAAGVLIDTLTGGWTNFKDKSGAIWDGVKVAFIAAWDEIKFFGLSVVAELDDAVSKLLKKIPGGLGDALAGSGTAVADVSRLRDQARLAHAAEFDDVGRRLSAPARGLTSTAVPGAPITVNNTTNVQLPPGSHASTVRAAGAAAETGAMKGAKRAAAVALGRKAR